MNNNGEEVLGISDKYIDEILSYSNNNFNPGFENFADTIADNNIFNKENTDLSNGILALAGVKNTGINAPGSGLIHNGSVVSNLDIGLEKDLFSLRGIGSIINKSDSQSVMKKDFQSFSDFKNANVLNKSDFFKSDSLVFSGISKELSKSVDLKSIKDVTEGKEGLKLSVEKSKKAKKISHIIEDTINNLEKPDKRKLSEFEEYLARNKKGIDINKKLEELLAANKIYEEQIKSLKASNEYLEKQTFEMSDSNVRLNEQMAQIEDMMRELDKKMKKSHLIAGGAASLALAAAAAEVLRKVL